MTIRDIDLKNSDWLKSTDLENLFSINADRKSHLIYNLNKGLYIKVNKESLDDFVLTHDMHWPLISYHVYGTTRLAWLLYKLNDVSTKNIFDIKQAGESIKFLPKTSLTPLIKMLNED